MSAGHIYLSAVFASCLKDDSAESSLYCSCIITILNTVFMLCINNTLIINNTVPMNFQDRTKGCKARLCVWKPTRTTVAAQQQLQTTNQNRSDQPWQGIISFIHCRQKERWCALNDYINETVLLHLQRPMKLQYNANGSYSLNHIDIKLTELIFYYY